MGWLSTYCHFLFLPRCGLFGHGQFMTHQTYKVGYQEKNACIHQQKHMDILQVSETPTPSNRWAFPSNVETILNHLPKKTALSKKLWEHPASINGININIYIYTYICICTYMYYTIIILSLFKQKWYPDVSRIPYFQTNPGGCW